jgi:8-oxo-dGTP pyrophosphatase MutT (NUDIX family)
MDKKGKMELTHAGGIIFRYEGELTLYLVISSSDGTSWVLPKGHIKPGEKPEETALREVKEETGIIGEIVTKLSTEYFEKENEKVYSQYFLIREIKRTNSEENRKIRWVDEQDAIQLLSFEDTRKILQEGINFLNKSKG